jgi:hypothetical protein
MEYSGMIGLERIRALASKAGLGTFGMRVGGKKRVTTHVLGDPASRRFKFVQLELVSCRGQSLAAENAIIR